MSTPVLLPISFTFRTLQQEQVTWTLVDDLGAPITGLIVKATLYADRSRQNPTISPGTIADSNLSNLVLTETPINSGIYVGLISNTFNPAPSTSGFVLEIAAFNGATLINTWDRPAVVLYPQSSTDLVLLDDVKAWLGIDQGNTDDDFILQLLISGFSKYVLNRTGRESFNTIGTYTEIYNGNGAVRMFLRNLPIVSIVSLQIGSYIVPFSTSITTPGLFIEQSKRSVALRSGVGMYPMTPSSTFPQYFMEGVGNIQVTYTAGHSFVPYDLAEACFKAVGINYKRKDWQDLASKSLSVAGGSGTTAYRSWALPPEIERVIAHYTRYAKV